PALGATGRANAEEVWQLVEHGLDGYWQAWAANRTEACEATRVRGEQSDQMLGLRMACLDRRRGEAKALIDLFRNADLDVVANAPEAVNALTGPKSCADVEALMAQVRPPEDPGVREELEQVRSALGEAKARFDAGKYEEALARSREVVAGARALAYRPAIAEALLLLGRVEEHAGNLGQAEQALLEAISTAESSGHDEVTAQAATHLVLVLGARQARYAEAHAWGGLAEGAISRIGGSERLLSRLLQTRGLVLYAEGRLPEAVEHHRRALALREKLEPDSLNLAESLNDLGAALRGHGKPAEAFIAFDRALGILARKLGPESDRVAAARNGVGNVCMLEGRFDDALAAYRQSLATFEKILGATHFRTITTVNNIGVVFAEQSRFDEALPYFERVLDARTRTLSPSDAKLADAHSNVGMLLVELGRHREALSHFEKAKEILQGYPADHFNQAEFLLGFAKVDLANGAPLKAIPRLQRVLALCEAKEGFRFKYTRARASFLLGRALSAGPRTANQARALALEARDALEGFGKARFRRDLVEIDGWLAAHP
ncbi:MAG: tetratricopeptide repeat protein, partial [Myxococcaceae bacterium]